MREKTHLKNDAAIVGVGYKVVERDDVPMITSLQIQLYAVMDAMRDAGIDRTQVGGLFTGRPPMGYTALQWNMRLINELKIVPQFSSEVTIHGAGVLGTVEYAAMAVHSGKIDYAIVCSGCTGQMSTRPEGDLELTRRRSPVRGAVRHVHAGAERALGTALHVRVRRHVRGSRAHRGREPPLGARASEGLHARQGTAHRRRRRQLPLDRRALASPGLQRLVPRRLRNRARDHALRAREAGTEADLPVGHRAVRVARVGDGAPRALGHPAVGRAEPDDDRGEESQPTQPTRWPSGHRRTSTSSRRRCRSPTRT